MKQLTTLGRDGASNDGLGDDDVSPGVAAPPRSGYKVIFVPFADGRPVGLPIDILTGFVDDDGEALGRPVGVAVDKSGALLVADDVGNTVWRVTPAAPKSASAGQ